MRLKHGAVVLVELNEVPNVVLDAYAEHRSSYFLDLLARSDRYTTVTPDRIQLDPWIAWPTLHRGVNDETHGLLRLGQDTSRSDREYPPIWRLLQKAGVSTGVYGSLFSSCETDLSDYAFFVPDVFSAHDRVNPPDLQRFQAFNLAMTRASARNVDSGVSAGGGRAVGELALSGRLTPATMARAVSQIFGEKFNRKNVSRRRNTQTEFHADVFASLLQQKAPQFSTFYTNNVAAAMHRFWSASVPGAALNRSQLSSDWLNEYSSEVFEALYSVERLLSRLTSGEFGQLTLIVSSALGQEEIPAENHHSFLTISDICSFARHVIGESADDLGFVLLPTMVPDFSLRFDDADKARRFADRLKLTTIGNIAPVETFERMIHKEIIGEGARLAHIQHKYATESHFKHSFTYKSSDANTVHISLQVDDYSGPQTVKVGNELISFHDAGVGHVMHAEGVNCTAQHCAEGSLFVHRVGRHGTPARHTDISILDVAPSLLDYFGMPIPAYMDGERTIRLNEPELAAA